MKKKSQMKVINTYSIRKCNIGVASFIIGSFLFLGVNGNLAEANDEGREVDNERQEVDNGQQQKLKEADNERQEVDNGQQQKLKEADNERQEVDNGQQQKLKEADNERQEVDNGQQQKLKEADNERQEVDNGQQQKLKEADNERQEVDNGQQQKLKEADNERQEVDNGQQQKLKEVDNERQEVDNGQQQKLKEVDNERQEVDNGQQELFKKINESTNRESTVKRLLEDVYSKENARGILNKIKPEDYNLSSKELINKIIKAGIDYSEENNSKYKVFASVPKANITLKNEYNIGNSLVVRSDKVIKPEDYVNYPEGYHVQSYVSKGKEYPSLDDIVKKRVTGSYKITYRLLDSKDEPVYGEDGQAIVRSLNVYFYNPEPALDIIKEIEEDIDKNNYQNGEEIKEDLEKIKNELERPTKIPDVPALIDEINNKKNQLGNLDTTAPDAPKVKDTESGSKKITGEGSEPGNDITVTFPSGKTSQGKVGQDGQWEVDVPAGEELKPGDKVTAKETDPSGNESSSGTGNVIDTTAPDAPKVKDTESGSKKITGEGSEPGNDITVTFPSGKTSQGKVGQDGQWEVDVPAGEELKPGDKVTAKETDPSGNESSSGTGNVIDTTAPDAPKVKDTESGSKKITGEGSEPGNDITVTFPSGKTSQGKVGQDGQWEVDVPAGEELKPGDKVTAKETDPSGNESSSGTGNVIDTTAPDAPKVKDTESGSKKITGEGSEPGNDITVTFPSGKTSQGKVGQDGQWEVDVPAGEELKPGDKVTAKETDPSGNESSSGTGNVIDTTAPDAPKVKDTESGSKKITGEGSEPGNDITVTFPSGKTSQGKVGQDGQWEVDVPAGEELKPGDKVTAKETDPSGNESSSGTGNVIDTTAPDAPKVKDTESGSKKITGEGSEPGNDITVTFPSGKTSQGKVGQDGQWEVDVPAGEELKPGDKVTAKETDPSGNESSLPNTGKTKGDFANVILFILGLVLLLKRK
ncbi:Ig-like domain-containing protein [Staphylococcus aureus]|uniref:Ig-like domain-containing protein n=1 Tax=Staphylococcus aureus TaxID=1280 RepID=UPI003EDF733B